MRTQYNSNNNRYTGSITGYKIHNIIHPTLLYLNNGQQNQSCNVLQILFVNWYALCFSKHAKTAHIISNLCTVVMFSKSTNKKIFLNYTVQILKHYCIHKSWFLKKKYLFICYFKSFDLLICNMIDFIDIIIFLGSYVPSYV